MGRQIVVWKVGLAFLFFGAIIYEEGRYGSLRYMHKNYYRTVVIQPCINNRRVKSYKALSIAIITILRDHQNYEEYRLAQESFQCYALYHGYKWIVVDLATNATLQKMCPHKDFLFARHCVTVQKFEEYDDIEWFLVNDADMGVINPSHLIEEWIDNTVNIIFYNRIFNHEVMAGTYLARNTPYTREFLRFWADYERKLPNSTHGTDNGAIHNVILEWVLPEMVEERIFCERLWSISKNYDDLSIYEACVRNITGETPNWPGKLRILPKGKGWARDTWLTDSMWAQRDFVLHGWQKRKIDQVMFAGWPSPFASHEFNLTLCVDDCSISWNWKYKDTFMRSNKEVNDWLDKAIIASKYKYAKDLEAINRFRIHFANKR